MTVRSISVQLSATVSNYVSNMKQAAQSTTAFSGELQKLGQDSKSKFDTIIKGGTALGVGLTGAFAYAIKSAADFDKQMSELAAVSDTNAAGLDKLRTAAINAGQATVFSAKDAAEAETELEKAGLSTADVLSGGLTGALSLASAGSLSLSDAATDAATALNEFQLRGSETGHVADLLAAGANKSATDVSGLAQSLNQTGLVAHQTGLSIEDTVGSLAAFAQAGLHGSDAGTSLKTMLQALQAPSDKTRSLMDELGISAYDTSGKFIGITAFAQQLQNQLKGLTQAQRDNALAQIFGNDAVRAADILYQQGAKGLQTWINNVNDTGAAADTARKKMDNLSGDLENLKGSIETVAISAGEGGQSGLRTLTQAATRAVNSFQEIPPAVSKAGTVVTGLAGALILGGTGFAKIKQKSTEFQDTLKGMGAAGTKASSVLGNITSAAGRLGLALAATQAASAAFGTTISPQTSQVEKDLSHLALTGKTTGTELSQLSYDLGTAGSGGMAKFGNAVSGTVEGLTGLGNVFDQSLTHAGERLSAIDQGLAALVSSGQALTASVAFQKLADAAKAQGISLGDLNAKLPNYTAAVGALGAENTGAAKTTGDLSTSQANAAATASSAAVQQSVLATNIEATKGQANGLKTLFDQLNGTQINLVQATSDYQASLDAATTSLKQNGKTLDQGTDKGRNNMDSLLGIIDKTNELAQSTLDLTGDSTKSQGVLAAGRNEFIKTAQKMGDTKAQAEKLADQLFKIPKATSTQINTPGMQGAINKAETLKGDIASIPRTKTFTLHVVTDGNLNQAVQLAHKTGQNIASRWGGVYQHAADGLLSDASIFSPKSPGRFMIAEPETGGEGFVPRRGDYARSTSIIDTEARWYGGRFVPGGSSGAGGSGSAVTNNTTFNVTPLRATFTTNDLAALQAQADAMNRVGRRR